MDERSFIHLHPSSERNVLIHLKMNELRWQDVVIHFKMKMRRLGKAKDVFIHFQPLALTPQVKKTGGQKLRYKLYIV
jgi:hypothetical protein